MTMRADDNVLIERAQQGDRAAFDDLVVKYQDQAYKYAYRLTRNPEQAADVVSDSFLRVFTALKNFKGNSAFSTWLYRIVTNCYLDRRKREKDGSTVSLDEPVAGASGDVTRQVEDDALGPVELAERSAREDTVVSALDRMPDYQKTMLVMYHVEMLSYEEIADALDLPLGTVKSRLNRARVALRDLLSVQEELFQIG